MKEVVNNFVGGMDRDTARDKYSPSRYYYAKNVRLITTDEGLVTGDLTNEDGNIEKLRFPDQLGHIYRFRFDQGTHGPVLLMVGSSISILYGLPADDYTQDTFYTALSSLLSVPIAANKVRVYKFETYVHLMALDETFYFQMPCSYAERYLAAQGSFEIRGTVVIRDTVVLFTRSTSSGANPQLSYQIWKVNTTDKGNTFSGLVNGKMVPSTHLVYNDPSLDFPTDRKVRGKGNYETPEIIKVYFTDFESNLRHVNIADPNTLTYTPSRFWIVPEFDISPISLQLTQTGGNYKAGRVQYSYCLFNPYGAQTAYSPVSEMINLTADDESGESEDYGGNSEDSFVSKSVTVKVENLDNRFSHIRMVAIHYTSLTDTPSINIIRESGIPATRSFQFVDTGTTIGTVTLSEFNTIGTVDFKCKTLEVKQNILFPMNVTEDFFDVSGWDARAYRFNRREIITTQIVGSDGEVSSVDSDYKIVTTGQYIPETHDCKQIYDAAIAQDPDDQFKYNKYGNFGGSGPNVTYEFVTHPLLLDEYGDVEFASVGDRTRFGHSLADPDSAVAALNQALYTSLQRGETYRYGIVLINEKGQHSFVQWIADIKVPAMYETERAKITHVDKDGNQSNYPTVYRTSDNKIYALSIGIKFMVSNLPAGTVGYRIVRCDRTDNDKTVISQGIWTKVKYNEDIKAHEPIDAPYGISTAIEGNVVGAMNSPEISFNKDIRPRAGDYVQIVSLAEGYTTTIYEVVGDYTHTINTLKIFNLTKLDSFYIGTDLKLYSPFAEKSYVTDSVIAGEGYYARYAVQPSYIFANHVFYNGTGETEKYHGWTLFFSLDNAVTTKLPEPETEQYHYIVNYCRSIDPYGGSSYEARTYNTYIPVGSYMTAEDTWFSVYGGDTYIGFFDCMVSPYDKDSELSGGDIYLPYSSVMFIPVESTINLPLRHDSYFNSMQGNYGRGALHDKAGSWGYLTQVADLYLYNTAYSRNASVQTYNPEPILLSDNQVFDHRIRASLEKTSGELIDSWTVFLPDNMVDVEGGYGPINAAAVYEDKLFFFQTWGLGVVSVNERILTTPDETGAALTLGKGGILDEFRYITTRSGCTSQDHVFVGGIGKDVLYYVDVNTNSIMVYTDVSQYKQKSEAVPLTVLKGMSSYMQQLANSGYVTDTDIITGNGVAVSYYPKTRRVVFAFGNAGAMITFAFNEVLQNFEAFYDFGRPVAFRVNDAYYTVCLDPNIDQPTVVDVVYLNGYGEKCKFYESVAMSEIIPFVNAPGREVAVFTNITYELMVRTTANEDYPTGNFYDFRVYNDYQDTGLVVLTPMVNCRKRMRTWNVTVPRNAGGTLDRIRSRDAFIQFRFQNADDRAFIIGSITSVTNLGGY